MKPNLSTFRLNLILAGVAMMAFAITGCLERKEEIRVRPDGAVQITARFKGTADELSGPFALPDAQNGWTVKQIARSEEAKETTEGNEGDDTKAASEEKERILEATASFAADAALPSTFGDGTEVYLEFPTRVWRESRSDGTYVHFRRRYVPRPFAFVNKFKQVLVEDELQALEQEGKEFKDLDRSEKKKIMQSFARFEAHKQIELLRRATGAVSVDSMQAAWLHGCNALNGVFEEFIDTDLDRVLDEMTEDEAGDKLEAIGESLPKRAVSAFFNEFRKRSDSGSLVENLKLAFEREALRFRITEAMRTHAFEISLELPGEIVAYDVNAEVVDGKIVWDFNGEYFCDRTVELMATSKLSDEAAKMR